MTKILQNKNRIRINNVEKTVSKKEIFKMIISQNNLEKFSKCDFQVIFEKNDKNGAKFFVVETDSELKQKLIELREIQLGASLSYVNRHIRMIFCFNCNRFGHYQSECKYNETCVSCAGSHNSRSCKETEIKCSNCAEENEKRNIKRQKPVDLKHRADSNTCPQYIKYRNYLRNAMNF